MKTMAAKVSSVSALFAVAPRSLGSGSESIERTQNAEFVQIVQIAGNHLLIRGGAQSVGIRIGAIMAPCDGKSYRA